MTNAEMRAGLCKEAAIRNTSGIGRITHLNPVACVECEAPCVYGLTMLEKLPKQEFEALQCGATCETCRQPCNLRRIALRRGIQWVSHKVKMQRTWMDAVMRPYYERRANHAES